MTAVDMPTAAMETWLQLSSLRLLVATADYGSLSAGAKAAGMAQPNATRCLKSLERRLGYGLVLRSTRGSKLTQEGTLTVAWAREVLESVERFSAGAVALASSGGEELTVGASMTVAEYLAPAWIGAFHKQAPKVQTRLRIMNSRQVIEAVQSRKLALGFVETPDIPRALKQITVWTDRLVVIVGKEHPWAQRILPLSLDELASTPLVEREEGSGTRAFLEQLVGTTRPSPIVELNSNSAICQSVMGGIGPAVLSSLAVDAALKAGGLVEIPVDGIPLHRNLKAIWLGHAKPPGVASQLLDIASRTPSSIQQ